jgi:mono/diheme cytochrome c family protein
MEQVGTALSVLVLGGALVVGAQDTSGPSVWSGVFTEAQAKRGDGAYQANCSSCHGDDLRATNAEAVDLIGPAFRARWNGKTLGERFERIRDRMPPGAPGSLGDESYMDILAFILQANDVPPGSQELVPETAKRIVFAPRP